MDTFISAGNVVCIVVCIANIILAGKSRNIHAVIGWAVASLWVFLSIVKGGAI